MVYKCGLCANDAGARGSGFRVFKTVPQPFSVGNWNGRQLDWPLGVDILLTAAGGADRCDWTRFRRPLESCMERNPISISWRGKSLLGYKFFNFLISMLISVQPRDCNFQALWERQSFIAWQKVNETLLSLFECPSWVVAFPIWMAVLSIDWNIHNWFLFFNFFPLLLFQPLAAEYDYWDTVESVCCVQKTSENVSEKKIIVISIVFHQKSIINANFQTFSAREKVWRGWNKWDVCGTRRVRFPGWILISPETGL